MSRTSVRIFHPTNWEKVTREGLHMTMKEKSWERNWSSFTAATHNVMSTNYIEVKIDIGKQKSICELCVYKDKTINHIKNECSKLAPREYKTWLGGRVDSLGIVQKDEIRPYLQIVYLLTRIRQREWDVWISIEFWDAHRSPDLKKYLELARDLNKTVEHEGDGITSRNRRAWKGSQWLRKYTGRVGNQTTNKNHPDYCIVNISQNTEKCPDDLRRIALSWTPVKNHQLTPEWKNRKKYETNNNNNNNN